MTDSLVGWPRTYTEAVACQEQLRSQVRLRPLAGPPRLVAGVDAAYSREDRMMYGAVVVMSLPGLALVDTAVASEPVRFPYIPGLLSFREVPVLVAALAKIRQPPDVILVDGQGIAHPRGVGLASHLGVLVGRPTIGCAKSRLLGEYGDLGPEAGSWARLIWQGEQVGWVLRSRRGCRPLFISPGHGITRAEALALARHCLKGYRLPLPLREAHLLSNLWRRTAPGP